MDAGDREDLASMANDASRESRYKYDAPVLGPNSPLEELCAWLQWNDPNGEHEPADYESIEDAWRMLASMLEGA